jgi:hypothetical protein
MISNDTTVWEDILLAVEEGQVVPIIGRDLLVVNTEAGPQLYHRLVAERLAAELKIPTEQFPAQFDTNDVICAYAKFHGDSTGFSPRVVRIVKELKVPLPEPLLLLAEIPKFSLFVSTTFDTLLEEAIFKVRGRKPTVVAFPATSSLTDFDDALLEQSGSLVFQVLGRVSASAPFALTEGQMLEQMHNFMSGPRRPDKLIARLKESHLLLLGVAFPDWLSRFLLRFARAKPLWDSRPIMEVIVDGGPPQKDFGFFLSHFSEQSRFFESSATDFVSELHRRWVERNPATQPSENVANNGVEKPTRMPSGSIFISYASEDRVAAFRLADQLSASGLEVWVDRRINPGDNYRYLIERHIHECCAFVPVLSRNTQTDQPRWFRKEWELAARDLAPEYWGLDRGVFFPVVVDDTPNNELVEFKRKLFGSTSAARAPEGSAPAEFIQQLDQAQKAWRKTRA